MTRKIRDMRSHSFVKALAKRLAAALVFLTATSHLPGSEARDSVRWTQEEMAKLSQNQSAPVWQAVLQGQETDFIEFLSSDRVLVGTLETSKKGWGLAEKDLTLLNAATGETIWTVPRGSFGSRQTLLATSPVILLHGSKKIGAINPKDGSLIWEQPWPEGRSLLLPGDDRVILYSFKKSTLSLRAVNLKDGTESWSALAESEHPNGKIISVQAKAAGGVVLLVQETEIHFADKAMRRIVERLGNFPMIDVTAFANKSGQLLWRKSLGMAAAVTLGGDDLFFMDATSITKADPENGSPQWRQEFPGASMRNVTVNGSNAYLLLKQGESNDSDVLQALDRQTGKLLWNCSLGEAVQSPMVMDGDRIYMTTATHLVAVDSSHKAVAWRAAIPLTLQGQKLLPDNLRVTDDRVIVGRENGVMAVQKENGNLLFAESIEDGAPFTNNYAMHTMAQAVESATPLKERPEIHEKLADVNASEMTSMMNERLLLNSQQQTGFQKLSNNLAASAGQRSQTIHQNMNLAEERGIGPYSTDLGQFSAASDMAVNDIVSNMALVFAGAALGQQIGGAIMGEIVDGRVSVMTAEIAQTVRTHASSLQGDFYIRPRYQQNRGWSLTVVNTKTGRRADILLTPDNEPLAQAAPNLPAFAIDPSGSRILAKGMGLDPSRYQRYEKRGIFDPTGGMFSFAGFIGKMWSIPYPSVLAFDLASLHSEDKSGDRKAIAKTVSAEQNALNDRLIAAAFQGDLATVRTSLDAGADVNATNEYGETALMVAAESLPVYRREDIVELLVQRGADASMRNPSGWMATDYYAAIPSNAVTAKKVEKAIKLLVRGEKR